MKPSLFHRKTRLFCLVAVSGAMAPVSVASAQEPPQTGLQFNGLSDYVGMGRAPGLGAATFTLECWVKLLGAGTEASSGFGGATGAPLICKGRGRSIADPRNANYFFAVRSADRTLVADFNDSATGALHPVIGTTPLVEGVWYHAAATYDGTTWRLYLNGQPDGEATVNATPQSASPQHFGLGAALDEAGLRAGALHGVLDEVRVWNYARSQTEIQSAMHAELPPTPGLLGRWSLNENTGTFAGDTGSAGAIGTIHGAAWASGVSFPAGLRVLTLAPSDVSAGQVTLNGRLADLGGAASVQVYFQWGASATDLNQATAPVTRTTPGSFQQTIAGLTAGTTGYYRAVASANGTTIEGATFPFLATNNPGLRLNGSSDYVSMGQAPGLGLATFTLECWFEPTGPGQTAGTGDGGIQAVPLITKGREETEGGLRDCNYFLGISPEGVLAADFEQSGGANYPVLGTTPVRSGVWHHAAVTYDGATWRLYLNGYPEAEALVGGTPLHTSIHHFGLGTALNTPGTPAGYFAGMLDEVRVWNYARTRAEIIADLNREVTAAPGLVARWGFDEGIGGAVANSGGDGLTGSIASGTWADGAPFDLNVPPDTPFPATPPDGAAVAAGNVRLTVRVGDPEGAPLNVKFYGRTFTESVPAPFRFVALPDTQHYSRIYPATFNAQTQWIVDRHQDLNIVYVAHEGDIVHNADVANQWKNANAALSILDSIPHVALGLAVGNHDQYPNGDPAGTQTFNERFPYTRYQNRPWYGGHYGNNNDNHYLLFGVGNLEFIAIHLEFAASAAVRTWAADLLRNHPNRRGILVAHNILNPGNPGSWTAQGQNIYNALKDCPNLFLMLCGHISGEGRRTDVAAGTVHTLLSDYQNRENGGDGWLRILEFVPMQNLIRVQTYSPTLDRYETDGNSQFTLPYDMGGQPFLQLAEINTIPGQTEASISWMNLPPGSLCEWYASASDGQTLITSPAWKFTISTPRFDLDGDGDVDGAELTLFRNCITGPGVPYDPSALPTGCALQVGPDSALPVDADQDADVDLDDFGWLQRCFGPAGHPVEPACLN